MFMFSPSARLYEARSTWFCDNPSCDAIERREGWEAALAELPAGWLRTSDSRHACSLRCFAALELAPDTRSAWPAEPHRAA